MSGEWTTLDKLRPGAVFQTLNGNLATRCTDPQGSEIAINCCRHEDGYVIGFTRFTKVREVQVAAPPLPRYRVGFPKAKLSADPICSSEAEAVEKCRQMSISSKGTMYAVTDEADTILHLFLAGEHFKRKERA